MSANLTTHCLGTQLCESLSETGRKFRDKAGLQMRVSVRQVELCQERVESRVAVQALQQGVHFCRD
jgi:hypothetical protein